MTSEIQITSESRDVLEKGLLNSQSQIREEIQPTVLWDIRGNTQLKTLAKHRSGLSLIEDVHYMFVLSFMKIEAICWIAFSTITEETEYIFDLSGPWSPVGKITAIC